MNARHVQIRFMTLHKREITVYFRVVQNTELFVVVGDLVKVLSFPMSMSWSGEELDRI